jgi:hypothetical protein
MAMEAFIYFSFLCAKKLLGIGVMGMNWIYVMHDGLWVYTPWVCGNMYYGLVFLLYV